MYRLLIAGMVVLGTGVSHAQEPPMSPVAQLLFSTAKRAAHCGYSVEMVSLDKHGQPKGEWKPPDKGGESAIDKMRKGNKNYLRAMNSLQGFFREDLATHNFRQFEAGLPEGISYKVVKLHMLDVVLMEARQSDGDEWLPTYLELTTKYLKGLFGIGVTVHEKYRIRITCPVA